jgi:hypothetical protein
MAFESLHEFRAACAVTRQGSVTAASTIRRVANLAPGWFTHGGGTIARPGRLRQPYKEHAGVHMVVSSRQRTFSQAPYTIGTILDDGTTRPVSETESPEAAKLINLFSRPNRFMTGRLLWQFTQSWIDLVGECFWVLGRNNVAEVPNTRSAGCSGTRAPGSV